MSSERATWGNSFPISGVTAGLHPTLHSLTPPTRPSPVLQPQLQTPCAIQGHIPGAPSLPRNPLQAQALASGKSNSQHCTGDSCSKQRNSADSPHVPEASPADSPGQQQPRRGIKSGLLQLSLRVTRSASPRMLTPNTHGLNVNCSYYGLQPSASPSRDSF